VQEQNGTTTIVGGAELWMALAAPAAGHPEQRHDHARIRLLARNADHWHDLGDAFSDGAAPGSREWSGSAIRRPDDTVSIFYTAAGIRGEARPTFHQRIVEARPELTATYGVAQLERDAEHGAWRTTMVPGTTPVTTAPKIAWSRPTCRSTPRSPR
jgi:levansucrase